MILANTPLYLTPCDLRFAYFLQQEEFEDIKGAIRIHKAKDRQHNGQKKKDRQHNGQKKDRQHNGQKKDKRQTTV